MPHQAGQASGASERTGAGPLLLATTLTIATGATDAISFLRLGGAFSSVMTGNIVVFGLSIGGRDASTAVHAAVAIAGFVVGVLVSSRIVGPPDPHRRQHILINLVLAGELLALIGFAAVWVAADGRPDGVERVGLLVVASLAMGVQSGAVRGLGYPGLPTTYLTGALTVMLADLSATGRVHWHSLALLTALLVGAIGGGLLVFHAPVVAAVLPVVLVALALLASLVIWPRAHRRPSSDA